jgi:alpha-tubulin suppressor-like RCC1 family protein
MVRRLLPLLLAATAVAVVAASAASGSGAGARAWAWGNNSHGELGNGTVTRYGGIPTPGHVLGLSGVASLAGGSNFSLALTSSGNVWAWGDSGWGQLGQGGYDSSTTPVRVPGLRRVRAIAAGSLHALALKANGTVWAWGFDYFGQVGNGTSGGNVLSPVRVVGLSNIVAIAAGAGGDTSYALRSDGTVWAWGYDGLGQLGNGTSDESPHSTPVEVSHLSGVTAIGAGTWHALAVRTDGTVVAWGSNQDRQLGAKTSTTCSTYDYPCSTTPVEVRGLSGVTRVAGGGAFSLALAQDRSVWGWGANDYGQLATGSAGSDVPAPTKARLVSVRAIAAGGEHTVALAADGTVWSAGRNGLGQLGDGTFTDRAAPVEASGVTGATAVGAGLDHSLAVGS